MEQAAPMTPSQQAEPAPPAAQRPLLHGQAGPVAAIAVGGALGACARYAVGLAWPTHPGHFPTSTLLINVVGCAVMGAFMVLITQRWRVHPLVRPLFGTGVLGGFTTFSTYEVDAQHLLQGGHLGLAVLYLAVTLVAALAALWAAAGVTRWAALSRWEGGAE